MLSRFYLILERDGQTDRQTDGRKDRRTDRIAISISRISLLTRDKNQRQKPVPDNRFRFLTRLACNSVLVPTFSGTSLW